MDMTMLQVAVIPVAAVAALVVWFRRRARGVLVDQLKAAGASYAVLGAILLVAGITVPGVAALAVAAGWRAASHAAPARAPHLERRRARLADSSL